MNNPLVKPLQSDDKELNKLIKFYNETLGFCPNSIKTMFIRPQIAYAFINLNKAVMENKGNLSSKIKRLIGYLASTVSGCRYCQAHTIRAAERYGSDDKQLNEIWDFRKSTAFSKKENVNDALEFIFDRIYEDSGNIININSDVFSIIDFLFFIFWLNHFRNHSSSQQRYVV